MIDVDKLEELIDEVYLVIGEYESRKSAENITTYEKKIEKVYIVSDKIGTFIEKNFPHTSELSNTEYDDLRNDLSKFRRDINLNRDDRKVFHVDDLDEYMYPYYLISVLLRDGIASQYTKSPSNRLRLMWANVIRFSSNQRKDEKNDVG